MALFRCPECGEKISSSAGVCIHCGYRFKVCPECGEVLPNTELTCNKCGYRLVPKTDTPHAKNKSQKLSERITAGVKFQKTISIANIVISLVAVLLFFILVSILNLWMKSETTDAFLKYDDTKQRCHILIIFLAILSVCDFNFGFFSRGDFTKLRCANWIKQNKVNFIDELSSFPKCETDRKTKAVYAQMKGAAFYSENADAKNLYIAGIVGALFLSIISTILFVIFLNNFIDESMTSRLLSQNVDVKSFIMKRVIPLAVFIVLQFAVVSVLRIKDNKKQNLWAQKYNL